MQHLNILIYNLVVFDTQIIEEHLLDSKWVKVRFVCIILYSDLQIIEITLCIRIMRETQNQDRR